MILIVVKKNYTIADDISVENICPDCNLIGEQANNKNPDLLLNSHHPSLS